VLSFLKQGWLILTLAVVFGLLLAFTDQQTAARIAENRQRQIRELAQKAVTGQVNYDETGRAIFTVQLHELTDLRKRGLWAYKVSPPDKPGGRLLGYAVIAEGIGWDRLKVLIGLSPDLHRITGLEILESRETPGLGERIKTAAFRNQFKKPADAPLELVKHAPTTDQQVQAITGATISSEAVTNMVNKEVQKARQLLQLAVGK